MQLQVVLVRGEGELSLRTSNGANHAQRDQQIILGTNPGRDLNGVAPLINMMSRKRRLEGQHLLAEEVGAHLAEEAVQTIKVHLQAGALDVSQPLLDTDQQCDVIEVWAMVRADGLHALAGGVYLPGSDLAQVTTNVQEPALLRPDLV